MSCGDIFLGLIAILFPPIAVWIKRGLCSADSLINILLCMLGYLPGLLHAWYIIARTPEIDYDYAPVGDSEQQRVTYYYVSRDQGPRRNYGTQSGTAASVDAQPPPSQQPGQQTGVVNKGSKPRSQQPPPPPQQQSAGPSHGAGNGDDAAPPSYSEVVRGDNKIQSRD